MVLFVFALLVIFGVTLNVQGHKGWGWTMIALAVLIGLGGVVFLV